MYNLFLSNKLVNSFLLDKLLVSIDSMSDKLQFIALIVSQNNMKF